MKLADAQKLGRYLPAGLLLIALVVAWFVLLPQMGSVADTQAQVAELQAKLSAKQREVESLRKLATQGEATSRTLQLLSLAVPGQPQIPELLIMVQAMGNRAGMTLINASPSLTVAGTKIEISLKGSYGGVVNFLDILNQNLRPGVVKNFSAINQPSSQPGQTGDTVLTLSAEFIGGGQLSAGAAPQAPGAAGFDETPVTKRGEGG